MRSHCLVPLTRIMLQMLLSADEPQETMNSTSTTLGMTPAATPKTSTLSKLMSHEAFDAEHRASLDRFAYIYIACEGAMIALVLCLLAVGFCVYKYRQRKMTLGGVGRNDKYRNNAYSTATSTMADTDHVESLFISESLPS